MFTLTIRKAAVVREPSSMSTGIWLALSRARCLWRRDYNHQRPHSALDDRTPAEFATTCRRGKDGDRTALEDAPRLPLFHRATAAAIIEQNNSHSNLLLEALT